MTTNGCSKKLCPMQVGTVDNCTLTKEQCPYFTQDVDYQKVLNQIKTEVAREIFEEIEKAHDECIWVDITTRIGYLQQTKFEDKLAELKKKYTEEDKENEI